MPGTRPSFHKWQAINLIAGHKEPTDANDLTCLVREIHEELFEELSAEELTHMQAVLGQNNDTYTHMNSAWQDRHIQTITRIGNAPCEYDDFSLHAKCLTHYIFHIYKVTLQTNVSAVPAAQSAVINEWGSAENIRRGLTALERQISKTVQRILIWSQTQERM
jgi:hypothetical protein